MNEEENRELERLREDAEIMMERMKNFSIERDSHLIDDYGYTRDMLKNLVEAGNEAMENALDLAKESDSPRAIEVLSGLLKTIMEITIRIPELHSQLIEIEKKKNDMQGAANGQMNLPPGSSLEQNNYYVTTNELLDMIEAKKDNKNSDV